MTFKMNDELVNNILAITEEHGFETVSDWAEFEGGLHFVVETIQNELWLDYDLYYDDLEDACDWLQSREQRLERLEN
jgi:hypothetical protein